MKKLEIIETPNYILAVSDEEIKVGDWYWTPIKRSIEQCIKKLLIIKGGSNDVEQLKIIAHKPKGNAKELDLPLLPEMVVEDDIERLCWGLFGGSFEARGVESEEEADRVVSFGIECYKAATKVYSEEDLRKVIDIANTALANNIKELSADKIIQSLKQPKWFIAEMETNYKPKQKVEDIPYEDVLQTPTINGKTYLVGKYLNE